MRAITYDQFVTELRQLGVDPPIDDLRVVQALTAYEGASAVRILRWLSIAAATGRAA